MPTKTKATTKTTKTTNTKKSKDKSKSKRKDKTTDKVKKTKKATKTTPIEEVVEEVVEKVVVPAAPAVTAAAPEAPTEAKKPKRRRVVDRESVFTDFDGLVSSVDKEIETIRSATESKGRQVGVKFLRSLNKQLKQLKKDTQRAMKQKRKNTNRAKNTSSGFMKPVPISAEMAGFTGWDETELKSRVDVTKYICNYIREKDLQNPEDRRQIIPDKKLSSLLGIDKKSLKDEPLTYYSLQRKIQPHFVKASEQASK